MANSEMAALRALQIEPRLSVPDRGPSSNLIQSANDAAWSCRRYDAGMDLPGDIQLVLTNCAVIAGGLDHEYRV